MSLNTICRAGLLASCTLFAVPLAAQESDSSDAVLTDRIVVTSARADAPAKDTLEPPEQIALPADAAAIAARTPGGALVGNGALSGQLSYRGLAGQRVLGRVNGQRFATGGPNAMDPPLHYAPSILVEAIEVARGVAPVSQGPSLAGAVNAQLVQAHFADGPDVTPQVRLASQYRSVDDSYAIGGLAALANETWRLGVIASREEGEVYEFPGGTAVGTSFERNLYGVHAGLRLGEGEVFAEYRRNETDPTGNPPFAMDIVYFDTDFVQGGYRGELAEDVHLDLRLGHVAVRHLMDNQTLRQPPAPRARATFADADTTTAQAALRFGTATSHVELGGDMELVDKFVRITDPTNAAFFIDAQPNLQADRFGGYVQWRGALGAVQAEVGARLDHTLQEAGVPELGTAVPMGPRNLANAFIAADRSYSETMVDGVLRAWLSTDAITPRLTLARKERVPSLLERFGWLPTEASFGLADGNIYVGNLGLDPETAWIAELGIDFDGDMASFRPTLFYRRVDDFIQGVPFDDTVGVVDSPVEMVAAMNGDSTPLQFANVDAELWGVDMDFTLRPVESLELSGTASFVRGERRDIADNLYRVSPANLRLAAVWQGVRVSLGAELLAAAVQEEVSATNDEQASDGYAVVGLFGRVDLTPAIALEAGVENLFDTFYQPHLAGRSRVGASDVPLGDRLPGYGRHGWVRLLAQF
ncbi:TonB-dependent receptor [Aurantiacibacter sp. MUD11]|uniref:TonB-dependent receptor plug domain-containing protein n=1 Tax=Aurantiacibacter sp. MUD11 TaxID=3003265 RepID=UPI0022AAC37D|nr:TonB-dependent receptor [Aurantiacibacter sp. MUD11]WAT18105.1 TonB-dependent receptor [Aurantiacibacter sp. MUD11]